MDWISLNDSNQLEEIVAESKIKPVIIYKHSTRCSISRVAFDKLARRWKSAEIGNVRRYFLDLLSYRELSNQIAEQFGVEHHSPQILVIANGKSVLDLSHYDIDFDLIKSAYLANGQVSGN